MKKATYYLMKCWTPRVVIFPSARKDRLGFSVFPPRQTVPIKYGGMTWRRGEMLDKTINANPITKAEAMKLLRVNRGKMDSIVQDFTNR